MEHDDLKAKAESKFLRRIKKRIKELTEKKNQKESLHTRSRYNFAIGELMFLIQE